MKDIIVVGAGSFGKEVVCLINKMNNSMTYPTYNFLGFIDNKEQLWGQCNEYGPVLGGNDVLRHRKGICVAIAVANPNILCKIVQELKEYDIDYPNLIDPNTSYMNKSSVHMGCGNIIGEGCRFAINTCIGNFNIIVNDCVFGHDDIIGNCNVFYPDVRLSGKVTVGDQNLLGVRTTVLQGLSIGDDVKIAAGSMLMNNAQSGLLYRGNPARKMHI